MITAQVEFEATTLVKGELDTITFGSPSEALKFAEGMRDALATKASVIVNGVKITVNNVYET